MDGDRMNEEEYKGVIMRRRKRHMKHYKLPRNQRGHNSRLAWLLFLLFHNPFGVIFVI